MLNDFKKFALKGNIMDLAVGVIIGGAFGKIVTSLVNDLIMPILGLLLGGIDLTNLTLKYGTAVVKYGAFLQTVLDFLIVAFSIFIFIRMLSKIRFKKETQETEKPVEIKLSGEEKLLMEIRDLLRSNQQSADR